MTIKAPISPAYGKGIAVAPGAATANATIEKGNKQHILTNTGANPCYVRIGKGAALTASAADYLVPAGAQVVVTRSMDDDTIAFIAPLGTTLHAIPGEGF